MQKSLYMGLVLDDLGRIVLGGLSLLANTNSRDRKSVVQRQDHVLGLLQLGVLGVAMLQELQAFCTYLILQRRGSRRARELGKLVHP